MVMAADDTALLAGFEAAGQLDFSFLEGVGDACDGSLFIKRLIDPWYEQGVAQARVQHRCAGKEIGGIALMDDQKADFVPNTFTVARELALSPPQRVTR